MKLDVVNWMLAKARSRAQPARLLAFRFLQDLAETTSLLTNPLHRARSRAAGCTAGKNDRRHADRCEPADEKSARPAGNGAPAGQGSEGPHDGSKRLDGRARGHDP